MIEIYVIQVSSVLNENLAAEERDLQESIEFYKKKRENSTKFSNETMNFIFPIINHLPNLLCIGFHNKNIFL